MSISETIAKNSVFNFIATASDTGAAFVAGIVLARYLGADQYGLYSLLMGFLALASLVVDLGMGEMVKRFLAEAIGQRNSSAAKGFVRLNLIARGVAALVTSAIILILSGYLAKLYHIPADAIYFMLAAATFLPRVMATTMRGIYAGFQKYEYSAFLYSTMNVLRAALGITLVVLGYGVKELLITYTSIWIIGVIFGLFLLSKLVKLRDLFSGKLLDSATTRSAVKYSIAALGILGVDYFLWQNAEAMLLGIYRPVAEVGYYNIAGKIPTLAITLIPFVFGQVLLPAVSEQFGKGDMGRIKTIYVTAARYLMIISFPIAAGGIALAKPIINILFGSEYAPAIILMQISFLPFAMRGLNYAVSSIIYGVKEPVYLLKMGAVLVVVSLGLNFWLIPLYGAMGAVIATSIPRMLALPLYIHFVSRKIGASWPIGDAVRISLAALGVGLVVFFIQHYTGNIVGLCLGMPAGIVVYIAALLALGLVRPDDIRMLKQIDQHMPSFFRRVYDPTLGLFSKFVKEKKASPGRAI